MEVTVAEVHQCELAALVKTVDPPNLVSWVQKYTSSCEDAVRTLEIGLER